MQRKTPWLCHGRCVHRITCLCVRESPAQRTSPLSSPLLCSFPGEPTNIHGPHPGSWGRTSAATWRPAPGIPPPHSCPGHVRSTRVTRHPPRRQRAEDAEGIVSKGFDFPDDLIPKICGAQISIAGPWPRAPPGKERGQEADFRRFVLPSLTERQGTCGCQKSG